MVSLTRRPLRWLGLAALWLVAACGDPGAPMPPPESRPLAFAQVAAGDRATCGLAAADGIAYCWGSNRNSALGIGASDSLCSADARPSCSAVPLRVSSDVRFSSISLAPVTRGYDHPCAIAVTDVVYCWGVMVTNYDGIVDFGRVPTLWTRHPAATDVAVGPSHVCSRFIADGSAFCWGQYSGGRLGIGELPQGLTIRSPQQVRSPVWLDNVAVGEFHSCGLTPDRQALCWGSNLLGELGADAAATPDTACGYFGPSPCRLSPAPLETPLRFRSIAIGGSTTCGRTAEGEIYCWGRNDDGQAGLASDPVSCVLPTYDLRPAPCVRTPTRIALPAPAVAVTVGGTHACALAGNGAAYCWGSNAAGQLGTGTHGQPGAHPPVPVAGEIAFTRLSAGRMHTCGVDAAGAAYCWGSNDSGQLGVGDLAVPTPVAPVAAERGWRAAR